MQIKYHEAGLFGPKQGSLHDTTLGGKKAKCGIIYMAQHLSN